MAFASISSHQDVLSRSIDGLRAQVDTIGRMTELNVQVTAGFQAGATRSLKTDVFSLGSGSGNHLVLVDTAVAEEHLRVVMSRSAFGILAEVQVLGPGTRVNGQPVAAGAILNSETLPLDIAIGENQVRIARPTGNAVTKAGHSLTSQVNSLHTQLPRDPVLRFAVLSLVVLFLGALAIGQLRWDPDLVVDVNFPRPNYQIAQVADADWEVDLRERLQKAGLAETLNVSQLEPGLLQANGFLSNADWTELREVQNWYDTQPNAPAIIWDVQRRSALNALPAITMARLSEPKGLVIGKDKMIVVGEPLMDEWILKDVSETGFWLTRGDENKRIEFGSISS